MKNTVLSTLRKPPQTKTFYITPGTFISDPGDGSFREGYQPGVLLGTMPDTILPGGYDIKHLYWEWDGVDTEITLRLSFAQRAHAAASNLDGNYSFNKIEFYDREDNGKGLIATMYRDGAWASDATETIWYGGTGQQSANAIQVPWSFEQICKVVFYFYS